MPLNRKFFLISISLIFFLEIDLLGQDLFEFDDTRSSVFDQSVASSIEIGDITGDGVNDVIISGYNFGNEEGLFLDIYSVSSTGSIDTLQIDIIKNYFTYIPENHSSYYIGGDGGVEARQQQRCPYPVMCSSRSCCPAGYKCVRFFLFLLILMESLQLC